MKTTTFPNFSSRNPIGQNGRFGENMAMIGEITAAQIIAKDIYQLRIRN